MKKENQIALFSENLPVNGSPKQLTADQKQLAENFTKRLNVEPLKTDVSVNKFADNALYIPIGKVEQQLDEIFFGGWQTDNFQSTVVANEIIGSIELRVFHPVFGWISRIGAGSVMIQQKKDSKITDIGAKIKNTLTKDYPHLKAQCVKNAALSLGRIFGRDLNRDFQQELTPESKTIGDATEAELLIDTCETVQALNKILRDNSHWYNNAVVADMIIAKRKELNERAKQNSETTKKAAK